MCQISAQAAAASSQAAQTAQKKAYPQSMSPGLLCQSGDSPRPPASESSWAGRTAESSASAYSESPSSSDFASELPDPQSD